MPRRQPRVCSDVLRPASVSSGRLARAPRRVPNEVEIAVEATGLNFRDSMWTTVALAGRDRRGRRSPVRRSGCECAGRIARVGCRVTHLRPGDRVAAFAASAFSTHVMVPAARSAKLPAGVSCEAGATIPVAFLTAYYSLMTLAKLKPGEWVLIHGGAGACRHGGDPDCASPRARIIATAGSQAKRDLLSALGVRSRSRFAFNRVSSTTSRAITGSGVDVVLNSLAGDAMERSIACLRSVRPLRRARQTGLCQPTPISGCVRSARISAISEWTSIS